jgi:hypothetical protein
MKVELENSPPIRGEVIMVKRGILALVAALSLSVGAAGENTFVMNFDLITKSISGSVGYSIQFQGIHLSTKKPFHGNDLGEFDYFLTISEFSDGKGKLTIEIYQYESRRKKSDVISEVVAEVDFALGSPAVFEGNSDKFGIDLAFSIDQE